MTDLQGKIHLMTYSSISYRTPSNTPIFHFNRIMIMVKDQPSISYFVLSIFSLYLSIDVIGLTRLSRKTSTSFAMVTELEDITMEWTMTTGSNENMTTPYFEDEYVYDHSDVIINFVLASIIGFCGFFGIIGNSLVVISWAMSKKLQNITNIFVIRQVSYFFSAKCPHHYKRKLDLN